jgi:hypothetical protein
VNIESAPPTPPVVETEAEALQPSRPAPIAASVDAPKEVRAPAASAATTIRVELEKIDRVVNMVGEIVIAQAMLGQVVQELPPDIMNRVAQRIEDVFHHTTELKNSVMSMRAQPVRTVFQRMTRLVRELGTKTGKKVQLENAGREHGSRQDRHRAAERPDHPHHPQLAYGHRNVGARVVPPPRRLAYAGSTLPANGREGTHRRLHAILSRAPSRALPGHDTFAAVGCAAERAKREARRRGGALIAAGTIR